MSADERTVYSAVEEHTDLHYKGTVESDVYIALRRRIRLFESFVDRLQPILARIRTSRMRTARR